MITPPHGLHVPGSPCEASEEQLDKVGRPPRLDWHRLLLPGMILTSGNVDPCALSSAQIILTIVCLGASESHHASPRAITKPPRALWVVWTMSLTIFKASRNVASFTRMYS
jgi:hypothetical protein